jgi:hypothetical protein
MVEGTAQQNRADCEEGDTIMKSTSAQVQIIRDDDNDNDDDDDDDDDDGNNSGELII